MPSVNEHLDAMRLAMAELAELQRGHKELVETFPADPAGTLPAIKARWERTESALEAVGLRLRAGLQALGREYGSQWEDEARPLVIETLENMIEYHTAMRQFVDHAERVVYGPPVKFKPASSRVA